MPSVNRTSGLEEVERVFYSDDNSKQYSLDYITDRIIALNIYENLVTRPSQSNANFHFHLSCPQITEQLRCEHLKMSNVNKTHPPCYRFRCPGFSTYLSLTILSLHNYLFLSSNLVPCNLMTS